jgi:hypothetical protein
MKTFDLLSRFKLKNVVLNDYTKTTERTVFFENNFATRSIQVKALRRNRF